VVTSLHCETTDTRLRANYLTDAKSTFKHTLTLTKDTTEKSIYAHLCFSIFNFLFLPVHVLRAHVVFGSVCVSVRLSTQNLENY